MKCPLHIFYFLVLCTVRQPVAALDSDSLFLPSLGISVSPQSGSPTLPAAVTEALLGQAVLVAGQRLQEDWQKATHVLKAVYFLKDLSSSHRLGKATVSIAVELQETPTRKTLWSQRYSGEKTPALAVDGLQTAYFQAFSAGAREVISGLAAVIQPQDLQSSFPVTSFGIQVLSPEGSPPGIKTAAERALGKLLEEQGFQIVPMRQQADHGLELLYFLQASSPAPGMFQGAAILVLKVQEFQTGRILFTEVQPSPPSLDRSSLERAYSQAVTSTLTHLVPGLGVLKAQEPAGPGNFQD